MRNSPGRSALFGFGALVAATVVVVLLDAVGDLPESAPILIVVLILLPFVVYAVASGDLREVAGFGMRFTFATRKTPIGTADPIPLVYYDAYAYRAPNLQKGQSQSPSPNTLRILLDQPTGEDVYYHICEYLADLYNKRLWSSVDYVIVVNEAGHLLAFMLSAAIVQNSPKPPHECDADQLIDWIQQQNEQGLQSLRGYVSPEQVIGNDLSRSQVLARMQTRELSALPVVDRKGTLIGVVEKARVVENIITDLTTDGSGDHQ